MTTASPTVRPPAASIRSRFGATDAVFFATLALQIAFILALRYCPYADATNHLARIVLMEAWWFGQAPPYVQVDFIPTQYLLLDLLGVGLVHWFSAALAYKVLTLLSLIAMPLGMYVLLRVTAPSRRGWATVAVLLSLNWYFFWGFFYYLVAIGVLLVCLALYFRHLETRSRRTAVGLALVAPTLVLLHKSAAICLLAVVCIDVFLRLLPRWRREPAAQPLAAITRPALFLFPMVLLAAIISLTDPRIPDELRVLDFRGPASKLSHLVAPLYAFTLTQAVMLTGAYTACLLVFVVTNRHAIRFAPIGLGALSLLLLYLISPVGGFGTYYTDERFLLPSLLLPFCLMDQRPARHSASRHWHLVAVAGVLVHLAILAPRLLRIDQQLADAHAAMRHLEPGSTVLPLIADSRRDGRMAPYLHFAHWHVIDTHGRVPRTFNWPEYTFYYHFRFNTSPTWTPDFSWGTTEFQPLDWALIREQYQYIVLHGRDPRAHQQITPHATLLAEAGETSVYRIND